MKVLVTLKTIGEAAHSRSQEVAVVLDKCDMCKRTNVPTIYTDSSDGEYGGISLCKRCVITLFCQAEEQHEGSRILFGDL